MTPEYKNKTEGMERSYSRKGNPWDNACIESFHSLIKREWINFYHFETMKEAKKAVFEYIEGFYNTIRIHSHCGYESPMEYENNYKILKKMRLEKTRKRH